MPSITIPTRPAGSIVHRVTPPEVYVDGVRRHDLFVHSWEVLPCPEFGRAVIGHRDARSEGEHLLPPPDSTVCVRVGGGWFEGRVSGYTTNLSTQGDHVLAEVRHMLWHLLGQPVVGRWECRQAQPAWDGDARMRFNSTDGLASETTYEVAGRKTTVLDQTGAGVPWSAAAILTYLLAAHLPPGVIAPGADELADLAGQTYPDAVDLTDLPLREALARVAREAGLAIRAGRGSAGVVTLVFYEPGVQGRQRQVVLAASGSALAGSGSNVQAVQTAQALVAAGSEGNGDGFAAAQVSVRWYGVCRGGQPRVVATGGRKRFEVALPLSPCWPEDRQSSRYRDFVRSRAADWPAVADVFRRWVLNESGRYSRPPFNVTPFSCGAISAEDFRLHLPRPLEPCLSADAAGLSRGIVVELSVDGGQSWRPYEGHALLAESECSLYLSDDALDGEYFQAALAGEARLRVTGTLTADTRLRVELPGNPRLPVRRIRCAAARLELVHPWSIFIAAAPAGGVVRDDSRILRQTALRAQAMRAGGAQAVVTLAWPDASYEPGDCIEGVSGRQINFRADGTVAPHVERIVHSFDGDWQTRLHIRG